MTSKQGKKTQKNQKNEDWHPAEVVCALRMAGWSLRGLSRLHGLSKYMVARAMKQRYPRSERIIADTLHLHPSEIWPSRYVNGVHVNDLKKQARRNLSASKTRRNVKEKSAK